MREPEGIETPPPGQPSERTWSKGREPDIRNVEAVGSNPITSTESPGQRAKRGIPNEQNGFGEFYFDLVEVVARRRVPVSSLQATAMALPLVRP